MKILIYIFITILILVVTVLVAYSLSSRKQDETGLQNGYLRTCPGSPNCVSSEEDKKAEKVEAFSYTIQSDQAWKNIKQAIRDTGGLIQSEQETYLHAIYTTKILRFKDDVELRLDKDRKLIHIRSASRVGRRDFGANTKRVELIRQHFDAK